MERFGKYVRLRELGSGGFGTVYEGRDTQLDRPVALKFLDSNDPDDVERFRREARLAAQLSHPAIVAVHDVFEAEGRHVIVMDFIDGVPAGRAGLSPVEAAALMRDVAGALAHAHARGVIHRDLKPDNILVRDGLPVVTDFGLARGLHETSTLSMTGVIQGTPAYMAPEQARGDKHAIGPATDVYGLGATLYALVTGRPPFSGRSAIDVVRRVIEEEPPAAACDEALGTIIVTCMEKDPRRRYPTAAVVAEELGRFLRGEPILARPAGPAERVRRWIARHRVVAALSAALAVVVLGAVVAGTLGLRAAHRERVARVDETQRRLDASARHLKMQRALLTLTESERGWVDPELDVAAWRAGLESALAQLDGEDAEASFYRGWALRLLGRRAEAIAALDRALAVEPDHARARFERCALHLAEYLRLIYVGGDADGRTALMTEHLAKAREDATAARGETAGTDAELLIEAYGHLVAGRDKEAVEICVGRIAGGGRFEQFRLLLGIGLNAEKQHAAAIEHLNEAVYLHPNLREGLMARAYALTEVERHAEAIPDLDRLLAIDPDDPLARFLRGSCRRRTGRPDLAIADFDEALRIDPRFAPALTGRSAARYQQGEYAAAIEDARLALDIRPRNAAAWMNLGAALLGLARVEEALEALDRAVEIEPENVDGRLNRSTALAALQRVDDALADLETASRLAPDNPLVQFNLGVQLKTLGRWDESLAALNRALDLNPDLPSALVHRALVRIEFGQFDAARADVLRSLRFDATPAVAVNRAIARESLGDVSGAEEDLALAIRLDARSTQAYYNRAGIRIRRRDFAGAEEDLSAALSLDPTLRAALLDRSGVRLQLGDWTGARDDGAEAIRLAPEDPSAYVNRAVARANLGDLTGGAADLEKALELAPADWPARATTEGALRDVRRRLRESEF